MQISVTETPILIKTNRFPNGLYKVTHLGTDYQGGITLDTSADGTNWVPVVDGVGGSAPTLSSDGQFLLNLMYEYVRATVLSSDALTADVQINIDSTKNS